MRVQGTFARDSDGRIMMESHLSSGESYRTIEDWATVSPALRATEEWVNAPAVFIDLRKRTVFKVPEISICTKGWAYSNAGRVIRTEQYKTIHGINCRQVVFPKIGTDQDGGEAWISESLGIVMLDWESTPNWRKKWQIVQIEYRAPLPGLFELPIGFSSVEEGR